LRFENKNLPLLISRLLKGEAIKRGIGREVKQRILKSGKRGEGKETIEEPKEEP